MTEAHWLTCVSKHDFSYIHKCVLECVVCRMSIEAVAARMKELFDARLVAITDGGRPSVLASKEHVRT